MANIDKITKLPPSKALTYCLLVAISVMGTVIGVMWHKILGMQSSGEGKSETRISKNEKIIEYKDRKIDSLSSLLMKTEVDCSAKLEAKDDEMKQFLRDQLAESKAVKLKALNAEKKVDPAINQAINQTITRLTNEHQNNSNQN